MDLLILCSIIFVIAVVGLYLNKSWQQYCKGLSDGKNDLFARSNTSWYRRGYKAGLSEVSKSKIYIGKGFKSESGSGYTGFAGVNPDSNGKVYQYFHFITDGELKGMYQPILTFGQIEYRNELRELELADIINSGFHVHVIDPKGN